MVLSENMKINYQVGFLLVPLNIPLSVTTELLATATATVYEGENSLSI